MFFHSSNKSRDFVLRHVVIRGVREVERGVTERSKIKSLEKAKDEKEEQQIDEHSFCKVDIGSKHTSLPLFPKRRRGFRIDYWLLDEINNSSTSTNTSTPSFLWRSISREKERD
jgi:hypothetical protein